MNDIVGTSHRIQTNNINVFVREAGPVDGPPVLLLHGWPDSSAMWRHQIAALSAKGFHVIAPDLRGFGESDKPANVDDYAFLTTIADITGVLEHFGITAFQVVGHDWGAFFAWALACFLPERVQRLAVLSVGHPTAFGAAGWEQKEKSWYMLWFQFPGVAESVFPADNWSRFRAFSRNGGGIDERIADLERPGALTASLAIYRANIDPASFGAAEGLELPKVACPTFAMWSSGDHFLTEQQMTNSAAFVTGTWEYVRLEGGSHWIPIDHAEECSTALLGFLAH